MAVVLSRLLSLLEKIAPLDYAEEWDNVGLLIDPAGTQAISISRLMLTIDLTPAVMDEAAERRADMVVAYHPPIFKPLKRLRQNVPAERVVMQAVRAGLPVYSPHTALDAAPKGVNDWLAEGVGPGLVQPLEQSFEKGAAAQCRVSVLTNSEEVERLRHAVVEQAGVKRIASSGERRLDAQGQPRDDVWLEFVCERRALERVATALGADRSRKDLVWDVTPLGDKPLLGTGAGRGVRLQDALTLPDLVEQLKQHLGLPKLWVAASDRHKRGGEIERVALCAGAGGSLFERHPDYDLYVTGEMRHHDVKDAVASGRSVILCGHTNTERGYLPLLRRRIETACEGEVKVLVSKRDADPLVVT
ncbi:MAG: Nif3-like dinuclear metal center hexameric protein [Polyangiaceae bacterium]